jgi:hypothetical protein
MFVEWLAEDRGVIVAPQQVRPSLLSVPEITARWRRVNVPQRLRAGELDVTMFSGWPRAGGGELRLVFVADFGECRGVVAV